jgi:basic membrane lipoprotein Med (substrate-binding protein (PBP1-ABC) superfamily)
MGLAHPQGPQRREGPGDITYKFSENVANNDYERIMRQYAEEGSDLVIGEIFGVERAARRVAANTRRSLS